MVFPLTETPPEYFVHSPLSPILYSADSSSTSSSKSAVTTTSQLVGAVVLARMFEMVGATVSGGGATLPDTVSVRLPSSRFRP